MPDVEILSQTRCRLGEGPFFCDRRSTLYWFDIVEKKRYAHSFKTGLETFINLPEMASAMAVVDDAHDLIFTESGLWLHEVGTGCWTPCAYIEPDNAITRSNDARVHPCGAFWLGTMGKNAEQDAGAIYHFHQGSVTLLYDDITIPNAICFTQDGSRAFFCDTKTAKLMSVETDPETGLPLGDPAVFYDHSGEKGGLDGAICGADGTLYNARWGASVVDAYDSNGVRTQSYDVPVMQPSCPAFIGNGRIAVTSAWQGMTNEQNAADANAGKTFVIDAGAQHVFETKVVI